MRGALVFGLGLLGACSTALSGPDRAELAALIAETNRDPTPHIRSVRCDFIAEEGSEWRCRYEAQARNSRWVALEAMVARDGDRWILIDGVRDPDAAPPR